MIILFKLLLAHLIGDFLLQPLSWVKDKEKHKIKSVKLYIHILIHGLLIKLFLWDWTLLPLAIVMMLIHGLIDVSKLYFQKKNNYTKWFIADQLLHIGSILILWLVWVKQPITLESIFQNHIFWIYSSALIFLTVAAGVIIRVLLTSWSKDILGNKDDSLASAGKYIGILERLLVFVFIVSNHWEAVGFLLAAKSVFRFGDLKESKDRKLTEYILIGTLLSFGIALLTGMAVLKLTV